MKVGLSTLNIRERFARPFQAERGASFVESVLVIPILVLFAFGVVEVGRAFGQYVTLVSIAEEGARVGSRIPGIGVGFLRSAYDLDTNTATNIAYESEGDGTIVPDNHTTIRARVARLLQLNLDNLHVNGIQIESTYLDTDPGNGIRGDTISVKVYANYESLFQASSFLTYFFGWDGLPIHTEAVGPYIDLKKSEGT